LFIWIASTPESRMFQHFLLKLFSEKNIALTALKKVKFHQNQQKFHFTKATKVP
jgi:hypothetical protein